MENQNTEKNETEGDEETHMVMNEHNTVMNWNVYATMVFPGKPRIQKFKIKIT